MTTRMILSILALSFVATFAARPAEAGRPRMIILDQDTLAITHDPEFEGWANLSLLRTASGQALLLDARAGQPIVVTPLGFEAPPAGVYASYVEAPDGTIWAAIAWTGSLRILSYSDGDTATHEPGGPYFVSDPASVQLGIIDLLIGPLDTPVPTLAVHDDGELYAGVSGALVPIEHREDGWHLVP